MSLRAILALLLIAAAAVAGSPAEAYTLALRDLERLPSDARPHTRYLSDYHVRDVKRLATRKKVYDFWANSLSREAELVPLAEVAPGLWRLDLRDYRLPAKVWEKLAQVEPFFHAKVKLEAKYVTRDWPGGVWPGDGKYYAPGAFQTQVTAEAGGEKATAQAPWLDAKTAASLVLLAQSEAPVMRADWWLVQTAQQADRKGTGYYDWLEVKDRDEFDKLVGLVRKTAEERQREIRAIVNKSGVALNNRQVVRLDGVGSAYWVTLDSNKSTNGNNAVRNLNGDHRHDAEELYGNLPNGLWAFFLCDANGKRQDSAPDTIASDGVAPGNDRRVHAGISCVRCHVEGIRPVADWGRRVYRSPLALASPDYDKLKRLKRLYLGDLESKVRRDQSDYAEVLLRLTGMKPAELAREFARVHREYQEADVDLTALAAWGGYRKADALAVLKVAAGKAPLDPALAGYLADPEEPLRVEHAEEAFPLFMTYMKGYKP